MRAKATTMGALLLGAIAIPACGGEEAEAPKAPRIPAAVAERLAALSDETAEALEAGDGCAAEESADELEAEARKAETRISAELRPELRAGVQQLTSAIACIPPPPEPVEPVEKKPKEKPCPPGQERKDEEGGPGSGGVNPGLALGHDEQSDDEHGKGKKDDPCAEEDDDGDDHDGGRVEEGGEGDR